MWWAGNCSITESLLELIQQLRQDLINVQILRADKYALDIHYSLEKNSVLFCLCSGPAGNCSITESLPGVRLCPIYGFSAPPHPIYISIE